MEKTEMYFIIWNAHATKQASTKGGEELRKQIGAPVYIECSSKTQQNVKAVFDAAIKFGLPTCALFTFKRLTLQMINDHRKSGAPDMRLEFNGLADPISPIGRLLGGCMVIMRTQ
eukprot:Gb_40762 [translate_table: standard]